MELRPGEVENLVISSAFWLGRRVFVTGHTGFKGSWLSLMLSRLGARATGYSLAPPTDPNLFELAGVGASIDDLRGDIRDSERLAAAMQAAEPEIVIHMAAQPLVRAAYADPVLTYETNVMGTVNVLEAVRRTASVRATLIVTTDKCYENNDWVWGYREIDRLGGRDPYSNSKACAELAVHAYRESYFCDADATRILSARAGNVIGGGDFAADRIVPDAVRAFIAGKSLQLRNPLAVRPWQHVLEPLAGYLMLLEAGFERRPHIDGGWNFGPGPDSERSVAALVDEFTRHFGAGARWTQDRAAHPHEARLLRLDTSKARETLGWSPILSFEEGVEWTAQWYRAFADERNLRETTLLQVDRYLGQRIRLTSPFAPDIFEDMIDADRRFLRP